MTIKEVQELIANVDAKEYASAKSRPEDPGWGIFSYFIDAVRHANRLDIDLTETLVKWLGDKKPII